MVVLRDPKLLRHHVGTKVVIVVVVVWIAVEAWLPQATTVRVVSFAFVAAVLTLEG